jgi:predicted NACHT family NTPase
MLLHLAKELLARAEADPEAPIPVYVNLSSWTDETQPLAHSLAHWLVAELKERYGVRKDISQRWLEERCLLPLLDGLDELPSTRQERCVQAINQFQRECRPPHLVVCCRLAEFLQSTTKLKLNEAIQLLPFTAEQMQRYLIGAGRSDLWQLLQAQPELFELDQSPLFLSMMTLAFDERVIQELPRTSSRDDYRQYLFETYIEHMFSRETRFPGYSKEKTAYWLAWLAQKLQAQAQTEFLLEKLQPTWLLSRAQKWLYHGGVVVSVTLLVQLGRWLLEGLMAFGPSSALFSSLKAMSEHQGVSPHFWQYLELYGGWITPLIIGLLVGMRHAITPIETLKWSGAKA